MGKLSRIGVASVGVSILMLELMAVAGWQGWFRAKQPSRPAVVVDMASLKAPPMVMPAQQQVQAAAQQPAAPAVQAAAPAAPQPHTYYDNLRAQVRWVQTRFAGSNLMTPDAHSRMLLAKSAAEHARLHEVGLSYKDVYGIINAETSWVPRTGASKDGTPNLGIAQFEPATARALGLRNPNDMVESIHVAALHMKEAAEWSADRIAKLKLGESQRAEKLREGVSIYYNLSSRGRSVWNGNNTNRLPIETRRHIRNAQIGAQHAQLLDAQLQARL
jgi:hypothetical protein